MESVLNPRPTPDTTRRNGPDHFSTPGASDSAAPAPGRPSPEDPPPLHAAHTPNFPALLRQLGASLLVTTYQAGKLVLVRDEGDHLNAHFRSFPAPMGMALDGDRLAIGTKNQVWEFVNVPAVAAKLEPPGRHDACYLPRFSHFTGNIQIHEMAFGRVEGGGWRVKKSGLLPPPSTLHPPPSGSSTRASPACVRSTARPASRPAGGLPSSPSWNRPTAAILTASAWSRANRNT
jgi:hypothetical protein